MRHPVSNNPVANAAHAVNGVIVGIATAGAANVAHAMRTPKTKPPRPQCLPILWTLRR